MTKTKKVSGQYSSAMDAIGDILYTAWKFDDKPHKLFSCIMRVAQQFAEPEEYEEIAKLMSRAYDKIGGAREVWHTIPDYIDEIAKKPFKKGQEVWLEIYQKDGTVYRNSYVFSVRKGVVLLDYETKDVNNRKFNSKTGKEILPENEMYFGDKYLIRPVN